MHCSYLGMPKGALRAAATSNSKKIVRTLNHCWVTLAWRDQLVSQSLNRKFHCIKAFSNFLKTFLVDLKAFLGLVLPNQYCLGWCYFVGHAYSLWVLITVFTWLNATATISLVPKIDAVTIQGRLLSEGGVYCTKAFITCGYYSNLLQIQRSSRSAVQ